MITSLDQLDLNETYSYADYYQWRLEDFVRVELIKGKIFKIPSTTTKHQSVSGQIAGRLYNYFKDTGKAYHAYAAPLDVRFSTLKGQPDEMVFTVVQPDLTVFFDESNLDDAGGIGAPDIAVEILLSGRAQTELGEKFALYQQYGVKEYWLVDLSNEAIFVYELNQEGKFVGLPPYALADYMTSKLLPGFSFEVADLFEGNKSLGLEKIE
jgi:Uma2 family endonuclease